MPRPLQLISSFGHYEALEDLTCDCGLVTGVLPTFAYVEGGAVLERVRLHRSEGAWQECSPPAKSSAFRTRCVEHALADANGLPLDTWRELRAQSLAEILAGTISDEDGRALGWPKEAIADAADDVRLLGAQAAVVCCEDPELREMARRLLLGGWAGTGEELLVAAAEVLA
jgi:hypothetical protein